MKVFVASLLLMHVSQHASGVEVLDGVESVQLSCLVNVSVSKESTVVWSREDLKFSTVHIRQQSGDDLMEQNPRYNNRTWMRTDALETGDLSLTLRNPTVPDSETYTCTVRRFGMDLSQTTVELKVMERSPPVWPKVLAGVLVLLVVLVSVFGLVFYRRYKRMKCNPVYKLEVVKASEGDESVVLPFKTKTRLPRSATVEWMRIDSNMVVHVYPESQSTLEDQSTEMKENPLRSGDLSLTLYSPHHTDSGLYICTVQKGRQKLKQRVVSVNISEPFSSYDITDMGFIHLNDMSANVSNLPWSTHKNSPWSRQGNSPSNSLRTSLKSSLGGLFLRRAASSYDESDTDVNPAHRSYGSACEEPGDVVMHHQVCRSSSDSECRPRMEELQDQFLPSRPGFGSSSARFFTPQRTSERFQ